MLNAYRRETHARYNRCSKHRVATRVRFVHVSEWRWIRTCFRRHDYWEGTPEESLAIQDDCGNIRCSLHSDILLLIISLAISRLVSIGRMGSRPIIVLADLRHLITLSRLRFISVIGTGKYAVKLACEDAPDYE